MDKLPDRLEWEYCQCGSPHCHRSYPTNLGTFYQGSGFEPEERDAIDAAWNARTQPSDSVVEAGIFPRIVSHEAARQAAKNFIDLHFRNSDGKGVLTSIPAQADDDDVTLMDYIRQQQALAAQPRDDVRELLREARDFLLDTQGTDSVGHRLALRIDTALAPTTQGTDRKAVLEEAVSKVRMIKNANVLIGDVSKGYAHACGDIERAILALAAGAGK